LDNYLASSPKPPAGTESDILSLYRQHNVSDLELEGAANRFDPFVERQITGILRAPTRPRSLNASLSDAESIRYDVDPLQRPRVSIDTRANPGYDLSRTAQMTRSTAHRRLSVNSFFSFKRDSASDKILSGRSSQRNSIAALPSLADYFDPGGTIMMSGDASNGGDVFRHGGSNTARRLTTVFKARTWNGALKGTSPLQLHPTSDYQPRFADESPLSGYLFNEQDRWGLALDPDPKLYEGTKPQVPISPASSWMFKDDLELNIEHAEAQEKGLCHWKPERVTEACRLYHTVEERHPSSGFMGVPSPRKIERTLGMPATPDEEPSPLTPTKGRTKRFFHKPFSLQTTTPPGQDIGPQRHFKVKIPEGAARSSRVQAGGGRESSPHTPPTNTTVGHHAPLTQLGAPQWPSSLPGLQEHRRRLREQASVIAVETLHRHTHGEPFTDFAGFNETSSTAPLGDTPSTIQLSVDIGKAEYANRFNFAKKLLQKANRKTKQSDVTLDMLKPAGSERTTTLVNQDQTLKSAMKSHYSNAQVVESPRSVSFGKVLHHKMDPSCNVRVKEDVSLPSTPDSLRSGTGSSRSMVSAMSNVLRKTASRRSMIEKEDKPRRSDRFTTGFKPFARDTQSSRSLTARNGEYLEEGPSQPTTPNLTHDQAIVLGRCLNPTPHLAPHAEPALLKVNKESNINFEDEDSVEIYGIRKAVTMPIVCAGRALLVDI